MVDIFDLREKYPEPDDAVSATFVDLDCSTVVLTVDRLIAAVSNALSGHHSLCGMPDCEVIRSPMPFNNGDPSYIDERGTHYRIAACLLYGPMNPDIQARDEEIDAQIEADFPDVSAVSKRFLRKSKLGFDISRQSDGDI